MCLRVCLAIIKFFNFGHKSKLLDTVGGAF
jgi:hypothetical protein